MSSTIITWAGCVIHIVACYGLLFCAQGLEVEEDFNYRLGWVESNPNLWTATWLCWSLASMSLIAFAFVWARRLARRTTARADVWTGFVLIALGLPFDLVGEWVYITRPYEDFEKVVRVYTVLSVVTANGLYCIGGIFLSVIALRCGWLTGSMAYLGLFMWTDGLVLSAAGLAYHRWLMMISGGLLMMLFIPWSAWVGYRMLPRLDPRQTTGV